MRLYKTTATTRLLLPLSYFCCLWLMSSNCCLMANGEFYSSVDSLKLLGNMEATLLQNYRQYLKSQRYITGIIRRFMEHIKYHHELAEEDVEDYLGNPINAFTLIKRLVNDWRDVNTLLKLDEVRSDLLKSLTQFEMLLKPTNENELKGAIRGLGRLQTIYNLKAEDMANGKKYGSPLNWRDCFEIGTTFSDEQNYKLAKNWLEISLQKLQDSKESNEIKSTFATHIKEYLAWSYQSVGEYQMAEKHLDTILTEDPEHHVKLTKKFIMSSDNKDDDAILSNTDYARLCRGEQLNTIKHSQLNCKLDSKIHPFFILAPLQVEPILEQPMITLYHNILNEKQILKLINETDSRMSRSHVIHGSNDGAIVEHRVSQQTWIDPKVSGVARMMYKLVSAISGFDMINAEQMQVANYGIGGQYESHHDFLGPEYQTEGLYGDRISTNMFYLSDVEEGGYTVFPRLGVYLKPVKGAMVMWYNLHKSVDCDHRTLHAGCPVLKGSKRISNIWTHAEYQEFRRPCGLQNDQNESL